MSYRKIYKDHYGYIPEDSNGRTYDIHHKDGDRTNNSIDNLVALSIEEHYNIHLSQNDYQAAAAIRMRMDKDSKEISKLNSLAARQRVERGSHPWLGDGSYQKEQQNKLKQKDDYYQFSKRHKQNMSRRNKEYAEQGKHNFQTQEARKSVTERNRINIENGTHPFCNGIGAENSRKRVKEGIHHFQNPVKQRELSAKAKLVNSIKVKRVNVLNNEEVVFSSVMDATNSTVGAKYGSIQKAYKNNKEYLGYVWICLGKGFSSTTISSESTDQVIRKSSAS